MEPLTTSSDTFWYQSTGKWLIFCGMTPSSTSNFSVDILRPENWSTTRRKHLNYTILLENIRIFIQISLKSFPTHDPIFNIGSGQGLTPNRHQAIAWTNVDQDTTWRNRGSYSSIITVFLSLLEWNMFGTVLFKMNTKRVDHESGFSQGRNMIHDHKIAKLVALWKIWKWLYNRSHLLSWS